MTYDQLIAEIDDRLHFPGLSNSWTMPVENRLDMELTGIKTPVGLKIQGPDVDRIQQIGSQIEEILGFRSRDPWNFCRTSLARVLH